MEVKKEIVKRKVVTTVEEEVYNVRLSEVEANIICHVFGRLNGNCSEDCAIYRKLRAVNGITGELPDGMEYRVGDNPNNFLVAGLWKEEA